MKRTLLIASIVLALCVGGYWLRLALMSEETRISRLLDGMAESFNRARAGGCVDGLADGFLEETLGVDRSMIHQILVRMFLSRRHPKTKEFLYRVELLADDTEINVLGEDRGKAQVILVARFFELRGGLPATVWEVEITAELEKGEDGWKVKRSRHKTLHGGITF